jgi:hypothetical protein
LNGQIRFRRLTTAAAMSRTFTTREIVLLCGFAGGLAAVDGFCRSSGCVRCEVDLVQRSLEQREAATQMTSGASQDRPASKLSR